MKFKLEQEVTIIKEPYMTGSGIEKKLYSNAIKGNTYRITGLADKDGDYLLNKDFYVNEECLSPITLSTPPKKTIRDVEIGENVIISSILGGSMPYKIIDVAEFGFVWQGRTDKEYTTFDQAEKEGWEIKIKPEKTDGELITECLKYCKQRLKSQPEAGLRKFISVKKIDELIKIKKI